MTVIVPVPIERLRRTALRLGISIYWYPTVTGKHFPHAAYCETVSGPIIFLNPVIAESPKSYRCALAYALGCHQAGSGDELLVLRRSYDLVLPDRWLIARLSWHPSRIAEEADVLQEWVEAKLNLISSESRHRAAFSSEGEAST